MQEIITVWKRCPKCMVEVEAPQGDSILAWFDAKHGDHGVQRDLTAAYIKEVAQRNKEDA